MGRQSTGTLLSTVPVQIYSSLTKAQGNRSSPTLTFLLILNNTNFLLTLNYFIILTSIIISVKYINNMFPGVLEVLKLIGCS
jgi:hypothetical protein